MRIIYSQKFARRYRKLSAQLKSEAKKREKIFRQNPRDHRLRTHKLKGHLKDYWSFSVTHNHRIVFRFAGKQTVHFLDIGDHGVYD